MKIIKEMVDPCGEISAPAVMGVFAFLAGILLCFLIPWFPAYKDVIQPLFAAAFGSLGIGGYEVHTSKKLLRPK